MAEFKVDIIHELNMFQGPTCLVSILQQVLMIEFPSKMSSKAWLVFLLLALAMVAETYATIDEFASTTIEEFDSIISNGDADLIVDDNEFLMSSESTPRSLMHGHPGKGRARYISYAALRSNQIPCGRRGRSYYNCNERGRANPYSRGCIAITHCARDTS
ncbi:hypothetical protein JHK84_037538 [Glycine max]|nr:hypothetical protein JHK85_037888 [Glycine max]KAG5131141.1 hypothetical protein JHK84_037538 [Glycine max]